MFCFDMPFPHILHMKVFFPILHESIGPRFPIFRWIQGCSGVPSQVSDRRIHGPVRFEVQLLHSCESRNFRAFFLCKHRVPCLPFRL